MAGRRCARATSASSIATPPCHPNGFPGWPAETQVRAIPIVSTPDVLGGKPRIEGTRIGVHKVGTLVRENDWSYDEVCEAFDLSPDEVEAAVEYYDDHPDEMAQIRADMEATFERIREQSRAPNGG